MATVITNKGLALLAKLSQGKTLEITSAKTGAGTVDASLLMQQTGVTNPKQTMTIKGNSYTGDGKCALVLSVTNDDVTAGYSIMQIGVFANDPDEGEVLFSLWQIDNGAGINIPSKSVLPGYNAEMNYTIIYDQADSVNVNVDPSNTVSQAAMEAYVTEKVGTAKEDVAKHTANKQNPHGVTAAQLGLANVATSGSYNDLKNKPTIPAAYSHPSTHPASMITGLATVATTGSYNDLSNKPTIPSTLPANGGNADTVDNKHASDFAPASHVSDKNNPHGVTAEQVGTVPTGDIPNLHIWEKHTADPKGYTETEVSEAIVGTVSGDNRRVTYFNDISIVDGKFSRDGEMLHVSSTISSFLVLKGKYVYKNETAYYYIPEDAVLTKVSSGVSIRPAVLLSSHNSQQLGYVADKTSDTYPTNGTHSDGNWYKYSGQLGETPYSYGTKDLAAGVSPLKTGKLYFVYE